MKRILVLVIISLFFQVHAAGGRKDLRFRGFGDVRVTKITWRGIHIRHSTGSGVFNEKDLTPAEQKIFEKELKIWREKLRAHEAYQNKKNEKLKVQYESELKEIMMHIQQLEYPELQKYLFEKFSVSLSSEEFVEKFSGKYSIADNYQKVWGLLKNTAAAYENARIEELWNRCNTSSIKKIIASLRESNLEPDYLNFFSQVKKMFPWATQKKVFVEYIKRRLLESQPQQVINRLNQEVANNNVRAMLELADLYVKGNGVKKNIATASKLYRQAAEKGSEEAVIAQGILLVESSVDVVDRESDLSLKNAVDFFRKAEEKGMNEASVILGNCSIYGLGVEKDLNRAFEYYQTAAEKNNAEAQWYVGLCYLFGIGVPQSENNAETAVSWFVKAAEQEYAAAEFMLGFLAVLTKNEKDAEKWFANAAKQDFEERDFFIALGELVPVSECKNPRMLRLVAENGDAFAQYLLWKCYSTDYGEKIKVDEAINWLVRAADQGYTNALFDLAVCLRNGLGVEKNVAKAIEICHILIQEKSGMDQAYTMLGECYEKGEGVKQSHFMAAMYYKKAAEADEPDGLYRFSLCLMNGKGVAKDQNAALEYLNKAVEAGHLDAMCLLGLLFENGTIVEKDIATAVELYQTAAGQGYAPAQTSLGICYASGRGVKKNARAAAKLFTAAAEQNYAVAQFLIASCLQNGSGVDRNLQKALMWMKRAEKNGYRRASEQIGKIKMAIAEEKATREAARIAEENAREAARIAEEERRVLGPFASMTTFKTVSRPPIGSYCASCRGTGCRMCSGTGGVGYRNDYIHNGQRHRSRMEQALKSVMGL